MKRSRYLLVSVLGLALVGSVATAAVMSNKNSYNVMAENATISATPAEDVMVEVPTITIVVEDIVEADWPNTYGLKYHSWQTRTVFDDDSLLETDNSRYFYEDDGDQYDSTTAYNPVYDLINPGQVMNGTLQATTDTSIYRNQLNSVVTFHFPWYVTSMKMQLLFAQDNILWQGQDCEITAPGTYYFYQCDWEKDEWPKKYCNWKISYAGEDDKSYVEVNSQEKQFLTDYFSVVHRVDADLSICSSDVNVIDLENLLAQYDALDEEVRNTVNKAADTNILYNGSLSTVEEIMAYLRTYIPSLKKEASINAALTFNGNSDNSLLIAGVASLGLLSVVGVAYFINQKKKRA